MDGQREKRIFDGMVLAEAQKYIVRVHLYKWVGVSEIFILEEIESFRSFIVE